MREPMSPEDFKNMSDDFRKNCRVVSGPNTVRILTSKFVQDIEKLWARDNEGEKPIPITIVTAALNICQLYYDEINKKRNNEKKIKKKIT